MLEARRAAGVFLTALAADVNGDDIREATSERTLPGVARKLAVAFLRARVLASYRCEQRPGRHTQPQP